jgi:hypothetical protein
MPPSTALSSTPTCRRPAAAARRARRASRRGSAAGWARRARRRPLAPRAGPQRPAAARASGSTAAAAAAAPARGRRSCPPVRAGGRSAPLRPPGARPRRRGAMARGGRRTRRRRSAAAARTAVVAAALPAACPSCRSWRSRRGAGTGAAPAPAGGGGRHARARGRAPRRLLGSKTRARPLLRATRLRARGCPRPDPRAVMRWDRGASCAQAAGRAPAPGADRRPARPGRPLRRVPTIFGARDPRPDLCVSPGARRTRVLGFCGPRARGQSAAPARPRLYRSTRSLLCHPTPRRAKRSPR